MQALGQIDTLMRELLDTEFELTAHEKALDDMHQKLLQNEKIVSEQRKLYRMQCIDIGAGGCCGYVREGRSGDARGIQA